MRVRVLIACIVVCLAGSAFFAYQFWSTLESQEHYAVKLDRLSSYVETKQYADSLLAIGDFDNALSEYEKADSMQSGKHLKQNAQRIINMIQRQRRKADSLGILNLDASKKIDSNTSELSILLGQTVEKQIIIDSMMSSLQRLQENLIQSKNAETSLIASLEKYTQEHQFMQFMVDDTIPVYYLGEVANGKANGFGYGLIASRGVYEGEWRDNLRHGKGKYTWRNNHIYVGEFKEGKIEGYGIYTFDSGEKYEGSWKSNLREGYGTHYDADGSVLLQGAWVKDKFKEKASLPVF